MYYKNIAVGLMLLSAPMLACAESVQLSLEECLRIALSDNPTVKVADMEVERLDYSKKEVIGQLLPTIDFGANYNRTLEKQTMYMSMDFGDMGGGSDNGDGEGGAATSRARSGGDGGIKVGLDNSWSLGFQASLPLIAPQIWKSVAVSDTQILRSLEAARQSRQALVDQVKSAYYGLLLAQDSRIVIQESYDMARLTHETYVKQAAAGAASDYDVLRTSVAMKNIEPEIIQADIAIKQARLQLLVLMGVDSAFEFEAATKLADYEKTMYDEVFALEADYSNNADLKLLDIDTKLLEQQVAMKKLAFVPTLALSANYNWTSMSNGSPVKNFRWSPYSMVGLTLSVPIFHGGSRWNSLKAASIQAKEMSWQRANLERSISMQVDIAIDNIKLNVKQIVSSAESVSEADRAHTIMEKSFEIGAASYLDLRDSELSLTRARLAYYQSIYNYLIAGSKLELLLGNASLEY
ncbi:MAG: TolC family protein [Muribaculaceae bacterium]|nr:TolC family protein [Muribaculaceae bacterium]